MRIIVVGDIHGHKSWKDIINREKFDKVVFVGDYFDSHSVKTEDQINNFLDIIQFKKSRPDDVILLVGNHDHHYFPSVGYTGTSGYQELGKFQIEYVIDINKEYLQMAYQVDNVLFTHAGVGESFMDMTFGKDGWDKDNIANLLNELFIFKPRTFVFNGRDSYGDDMGQTPIWIRPRSLMRDSQILKKHLIQVVGHTHYSQIDIQGKSTGGRYYFIDCLPREYLVIDNGKFMVEKL